MSLRSIHTPQVPGPLLGNILVRDDRAGLPRYWATVWLTLDGAGLAHNTIRKKLAAIEGMYQTAIQVFGHDDLDDLLFSLNFEKIETLLTSRFVQLQNATTQRAVDNSASWHNGYTFIRSVLERLCTSESQLGALRQLTTKLLKLDRQFKSLNPSPARSKPMALRSLPASVVSELYEIVSPNSARNPFRTEGLKWRNFCLVLILLHLGLRRGEALLLTLNSLQSAINPKTGEIVYWLNVSFTEDHDPRYSNRPSIKTRFSHRQIPVSSALVNAWTHYVDNYRGRQEHSHLFLNNRGQPISANIPGRILEQITGCLTPKALRDLEICNRSSLIRSHDLRHTCAVVRISQFKDLGNDDAEAFEKMRAYFGWSYTSEMPRHYARAYFETELANKWNDSFDSTVEVLRKLSAGRSAGTHD